MYAFDLLELDSDNLRREPLISRKATLNSLLKGAGPGIVYNEHLEGEGRIVSPMPASSAVRALYRSVPTPLIALADRPIGSRPRARRPSLRAP